MKFKVLKKEKFVNCESTKWEKEKGGWGREMGAVVQVYNNPSIPPTERPSQKIRRSKPASPTYGYFKTNKTIKTPSPTEYGSMVEF